MKSKTVLSILLALSMVLGNFAGLSTALAETSTAQTV